MTTTEPPDWMMSSFSDWEYDNMTGEEAAAVAATTRRTTTLTALEKYEKPVNLIVYGVNI